MKRLLIVCFNIALASYIRRLVEEGRIGTGERSVEVLHFFELCSRVLDEPIRYEGEKNEYYHSCRNMMLEAVQAGQSHVAPYDAICIDEAQDFDEFMLCAVVGLLRKGGDLLIAIDPEQTLYRRGFSWKSIGVDVAGNRTVSLTSAYRGTVELRQFAARLLGRQTAEGEPAQLSFAFPGHDTHGEPPVLRRCASREEQAELVAREVAELVERGEYRRSEIAVVYDDKVYGSAQGPDGLRYGSKEGVKRLKATLERHGVPVRWVSRDYRAKEEFDVTTDRVTLISVHSAKGLDFDLVYLLPQEQDPPPDEQRDALRRLYVGVTRARHRLVVPFVSGGTAVQWLEKALRT